MSGYGVGVAECAFAASEAVFAGLVAGLQDPVTAGWTHAELEKHLQVRGRELMRQLLEDRMNLAAANEERLEVVTGSDGIDRTRVERGHTRRLVTVFGPVTVRRLAYRAPGAVNLYPADAGWNLPPRRHSHGLAELVAVEATRGSFEAAQAAIGRASGVRMGKRQIEDMTVEAAVDIDAFYTARRPAATSPETVLVLTADGKGVVMRPEALREPTAKAAAAAKPRLATRVSPGEKPHRKRMAELVGVYDCVPVPRTPAGILAGPDADGDRHRANRPKATGKWLTASIVADAAAVIAAGLDEAERRDPQHQRTWVALVDGNNHQIDTITAEADRRGVTVHVIIDFIHVAEYVWGAAWSFFDKADPAAEDWVGEQLHKILEGKARQVAAGIRRRATTFGYNHTERAGADRCAEYLTSKAAHLAYDQALAAGWPIATGVIEGACRHLVKDRLDITGARWGLAGAEAVLQLRALVSNGDFDQYWAYHLRQEHHRNHHTRYRQSPSDYALAG